MVRRIIEIADEGRSVSVDTGFLVVSSGSSGDAVRIPLDDIGALIGNAHQQNYTKRALTALAERGIPTVLCGQSHMPVALVWPLEQHYEQARRIHAQAAAGQVLKKRLWQLVVRRKLDEQAALLKALGKTVPKIDQLAAAVRSGDSGNAEAQAARYYWPGLFGAHFRRRPELDGANSLLNYGYAVLRATVARAVASVGLHPSFGIFHRDPKNAFQLVDDLMEPYRPRIDAVVHGLVSQGQVSVDSRAKRRLALSVFRDCVTPKGRTPLVRCVELTANSFALALLNNEPTLFFPQPFAAEDLDEAEDSGQDGGGGD